MATKKQAESIIVRCETKESMPIQELCNFQGDLKFIPTVKKKKLKESLIREGLISPVIVWDNGEKINIIDGHQRILCLNELSMMYVIPEIPIVRINAKDITEAKKILLATASMYGEIDIDGVLEFIDGINVNLNDYSIEDITESIAELHGDRSEITNKQKKIQIKLLYDKERALVVKEYFDNPVNRSNMQEKIWDYIQSGKTW